MTSSLMTLLGWFIVFFVAIPLSIGLHELGHLIPAKAFGVKCSQYMIGFGPTVWSRRKGETEYGVKAVPLGGYVRMIGMFPPKPGQAARADSTGRFALLIEQARKDANREVGPRDADRLFYQRSVPKKITMMLGGPVMNLLVAVVLITVAVTVFGTAQTTPRISGVSRCVLPVGEALRDCKPTDTPAPAATAGLLPGDVIVAVNGKKVSSWGPARDAIRNSPDKPITVVVDRQGKSVTLTATPISARREKLVNGQVVIGKDGKPVTEAVGFLGLSPTTELVPQSITVVPGLVGRSLQSVGGVLLQLPQKMVGVAQAAFSNQPRDPTGPVSVVGIGHMVGEVTAETGTPGAPIGWSDKVAFWLSIIASLNLALFAFNLIPLLPLDGGHVAGALWEGLRRQVARLRGRPDPGPVDVAKALPLAYGVATLLIGMSVLLMYADIVRPIKLNG